MRNLIRNTVINVAALGAVGLGNLLLIPFIVGHYGLAEFGLIVLGRLLLPNGFLAFLDFGFGEAATRFVAGARARDDHHAAGRAFGVCLCLTLAVGMIAATVMCTAPELIARHVLRLDADAASFTVVLFWTGLALLVLFPGIALEGALKGLERFDIVRAGEVGAFLLYAAAAVAAMAHDLPYAAIVMAFLLAAVVRYLVFAILLFGPLLPLRPSLRGLTPAATKPILRYAWVVFHGKVLSLAWAHSGHFFIILLVGPAGLGLFDVLMRLPKFAKSVLGLINSAILPLASRLETRDDQAGALRLLTLGSAFSVAATLPPVIGAAIFAPDILRLWLGPEFASEALWFAILLLWPASSGVLGVGQSVALARQTAIVRLNKLVILQVSIHLLVSLSLVGLLAEKAFIVGIGLTLVVISPLKALVVCQEYGLSRDWYLRAIGKDLLAALPVLAIPAALYGFQLQMEHVALVAAFTLWCVLYWASIYFWAFSLDERQAALRALKSLQARA